MADVITQAGMPEERGARSPSRFIVPVLAFGLLLGAGWWAVKHMQSDTGGPKRQTVKIAVLPDTPPPPPTPPEKKIEPEVKEIKPQPQQEEQPKPLDKPPEPEQIKMEGAAGDGPSAFGSGTVNKDYETGDPNTGIGGGGNRLQFALFGSQLQKHLQANLARNAKAKVGDYRVTVQVWVSPSGELRSELVSSTGDEQADEALRQALSQMPPIPNVPANVPQPIRLRISNRMTG